MLLGKLFIATSCLTATWVLSGIRCACLLCC